MTQEKSNTITQKNQVSCLSCADSCVKPGIAHNYLFCKINKKKCEIARVHEYGCRSGKVGSGAVCPVERRPTRPIARTGEANPPCPAIEVDDVGGLPGRGDDGIIDLLVGSQEESFPLLDNNGQSGTEEKVIHSWSRKQKRLYRNLNSWMCLRKGQGYQLISVHLTSIEGGDEKLVENLKKLRRRIERPYKSDGSGGLGYQVQFFKVQTSEGHGVLHMIWAIRCETAVWIPQKWLSRVWEEISGASIVWVARVGSSRSRTGKRYAKKPVKKHIKDIAGYFASQYLADQDAIVRVSWSWWRNNLPIVKSWKRFVDLCRSGILVADQGLSYVALRRWEMLAGWGDLLLFGWCKFKDRVIMIQGADLVLGVR